MALWTFINEYKGGTFIAQYNSLEIELAIEKYIEHEIPKVLKMAKSTPDALDITPMNLAYTKLNGTESVCCFNLYEKTPHFHKPKNMLINIVKTVED